MFGYVFPDKPELKICEFSAYRAVYCSLCNELRSFGFGAKGLLNYDFVFATMLQISLSEQDITPFEQRCNTNPLEKVQLISPNKALNHCAAALIISSKYKLLDNKQDEGFFKKISAAIILFGIKKACKRASEQYPTFDSFVGQKMLEQCEFEKNKHDSIDRACDPTAQGLSFFFEQMSEDCNDKQVLSRLGYLIGRFVYLADCGDDLIDDIKKNRYNPFIFRFKLNLKSELALIEHAQSEIKSQLYATIAQIETCYRLINPVSYKPILDNIIYLGLFKTAKDIGSKKKGNRKND